MDTLRRHDLIRLLEQDTAPCVSIYMPVEMTGREIRQNSVRLKNLLMEANFQLADVLQDEDEANRLLRPAFSQLEDKHFWNDRGQGLAIFVNSKGVHFFWLASDVEESVKVGDRYLVRPLLPTLGQDRFCYLLAFSQNQIHLFRMAGDGLDELLVPDLPESMEEALNYAETQRGAQVHSSDSTRQGKQAAVFHGHGGKPDAAKGDLRNYCRRIDEIVVRETNKSPSPLLLACVDYLASIYRNVSHVEHLLENVVTGSPDELTKCELHQRAWPLFEAELRAEKETTLTKLKENLGHNKVTCDVREIVLAAHDGRIDTLFFDPDHFVWGLLQLAEGVVDMHDVPAAGDQELIETAIVETLLHHGSVQDATETQLPTASPMAAELRYV